eukprot:TRINITY_DN11596_c0_g2_i1.p1 TRINITY_DN11596_c0_g2~~TRINITY_DN11596_c0_g2_i1.p1  ORF type:complete len:308 (-),score=96.83 TRINITY_DN11596_c0_g2_i1:118-1041(-)
MEDSPSHDKSKITIEDIKKLLGPEKPPTDDKEDIGSDKDASEYSLNSSYSEEDKDFPKVLSKPRISKDPGVKGDNFSDLSLDDIEDVISNPYIDMPEFYPNQLNFGQVEGLPGAQQDQLNFKRKSVLKNAYWDKVTKDVLSMATAKAARPGYLSKVLSLYLMQQEKVEREGSVKSPAKTGFTKSTCHEDASPITREGMTFISDKGSAKKPNNLDDLLTRNDLSISQSVVNAEIQKRIERLEKAGFKFSIEDLAKESKNMLVRMPPYKKDEREIEEGSENDVEFMRKICDFAVQNDFVKAWKGKAIAS